MNGIFEMVSKGCFGLVYPYCYGLMVPRVNRIQYNCFTNGYLVHFILFSGKSFIEYLKTIQFVRYVHLRDKLKTNSEMACKSHLAPPAERLLNRDTSVSLIYYHWSLTCAK